MVEKNNYLKKFLRENGFIPQRKNVIGIAYGNANRNGICFETSISFHDETKKYKVIGHGTGEYATLEEVAIAIAIPETRGGNRANGGRKKIGGGQVKKNFTFSADEEKKIQAAADCQGLTFSAYVRKLAVNATSNS